MRSVTPVSFECQFSQLGPGANLVDNAPGGGQVVIAREAPKPVGIVEQFQAPTHLHVTGCSYGSIGNAEIRTTIKDQPFGDFMGKCRASLIGAQVYVTADTSTLSLPGKVQKTQIFDGYVDQPDYSLGTDELVIPCRDRSSLLLENDVQARSYSDSLIYQIIEDLVFEAGYTTDEQLSLITTSGPASLKVGTFLKNSRAAVAHKSTAWNFIQRMADACGFVAFATPEDKFYFGPRVRSDLPLLSLVWGGQGRMGDLLGNPQITHAPMRNGAFHVQVSSHDPETGNQIQSTVTYVNSQWAATGGQGGPSGSFVTGLTESQARQKYGQIQVYDFYAEGFTADAAAAKAMAHAQDIQAHEIIVKCQVLGNASIEVGQAVQFVNSGIKTLDQATFFLAGVSHDIAIAQRGARGGGFVTSLVAWLSAGGA